MPTKHTEVSDLENDLLIVEAPGRPTQALLRGFQVLDLSPQLFVAGQELQVGGLQLCIGRLESSDLLIPASAGKLEANAFHCMYLVQ